MAQSSYRSFFFCLSFFLVFQLLVQLPVETFAQSLNAEPTAGSIVIQPGKQTTQSIPLMPCQFTVGIVSSTPCPPDPLPVAPQDGPPAPIECCCYELTFTSQGLEICRLELTFIDLDPLCDFCEEEPGWHWVRENGKLKFVCHDQTKSLKPGHQVKAKVCGQNTGGFISSTFRAFDCQGNNICEVNSNVTPAGEGCPPGEPLGTGAPSYSPQITGILRVSNPFPNPVQQNVSFDLFQWHSGPLVTTLYDSQGKVVHTQESMNTGGAEYSIQYDVSMLESGSYIAEFAFDGHKLLRKFQIKR